jgi:hypothetical protein
MNYFVIFSLLKSNGSLLAFAGSGDKEARVTAAIASSIWTAYYSNIKQSFHTESLNFVLMDCDVCFHMYYSCGSHRTAARVLLLKRYNKACFPLKYQCISICL